MQARLALTGKAFSFPKGTEAARELFEKLYIGGPLWDDLSEATRSAYIEKASKVLK